MEDPVSLTFTKGDLVIALWHDAWVPARIVGRQSLSKNWTQAAAERRLSFQGRDDFPVGLIDGVREIWKAVDKLDFRLSFCLPTYISVHSDYRRLPIGTPVFDNFPVDNMRLVSHEPDWDPYAIEPFMVPAQYRALNGVKKTIMAGMAGGVQVGAYMPSAFYLAEDPVWVWETGWRPAEVITVDSGWIRVKYMNGFRDGKGNMAKAYKPTRIWPVLCDHSCPEKRVLVDEDWISREHKGAGKHFAAFP